MLSPVVINPTSKHEATVIFLHGLGDTGHGWAAGFEAIKEANIKYIFPTAPVQPVSLNGGMPMPSWFNIFSLDSSDQQDDVGIKKAAADLAGLIEKEISPSIPSSKIIIGGFSQGGAVALYAAAHTSIPLGGIIGLSCWLPLHKEMESVTLAHKDTPLLQCHGDLDPMVSFCFGEMSHKLLVNKGMTNCSFKKYEGMSHGSSQMEMLDIKKFIKGIVP